MRSGVKGGATWFWIKSWSKKEETCWETGLEKVAAPLIELGTAGTCLTRLGLVGGGWNADL